MVLLVLPKVPAGETGLPYAAGMRSGQPAIPRHATWKGVKFDVE